MYSEILEQSFISMFNLYHGLKENGENIVVGFG